MSSRPFIKPHKVIDAVALSATRTSDVTILTNLSMVSYQFIWSAGSTPVGTITVEVSNSYSQDPDGSVRNEGTWDTLPGISVAVSGNTGSASIDIGATGFYAIRLKYTRGSGSATANCYLAAKVA